MTLNGQGRAVSKIPFLKLHPLAMAEQFQNNILQNDTVSHGQAVLGHGSLNDTPCNLANI